MNQYDYNKCVDLYADGLFRYIQNGFRSIDDPQDIVQHAFEKLWLRHQQVDHRDAKRFLFATARNAAIDFWRKYHRIIPFDTLERTEPAAESKEYETIEYAHYCLQTLNEKQKSIFLLREYEGHSYEDIAHMLDLTIAQVKVNLFRARKKVHEFVKKKTRAL